MLVVKKMMSFFTLDTKRKLLIIEAGFYLALARILKTLPFSRVSPLLGKYMEETSKDYKQTDRPILWNISDAIDLVSKHTMWESKCLVRAIAAMKMLERRKIESTLYLGTGKDENGSLIAHAWLRSGPFYITGGEEKNRFVIVGKFAKQINEKS